MKHLLSFKLLPALLLSFTGGCFFLQNNCAAPELAALGFYASPGTPETLTHLRGILKLTPEKRTCFINGKQFFLPHAVQVDEKGRCRITALSIEKVLKPLFSGNQTALPPVRTILLDPGHGGQDLGAKGKKFLEKDLNLALAKAIAEELKQRGFQVRMTRNNDRFLSLDERGKMANRQNADLFLSIHHNAGANPASCGAETYLVTPAGSASSNDPETQLHKSSVAGNRNDAVNIHLAAAIQRNMVQATGRTDRGVRFARFRVLVLSELPGVLIEAGFVSNAAEEQQCGTASAQKRTARAIAQAVQELFASGRIIR